MFTLFAVGRQSRFMEFGSITWVCRADALQAQPKKSRRVEEADWLVFSPSFVPFGGDGLSARHASRVLDVKSSNGREGHTVPYHCRTDEIGILATRTLTHQ